LWLLSGLPVGLALLAMPPAGRLWCFALFVVLETAHSFSPIVLAWTHRGFRQTVIWSNPWKYIGLPAAVFVFALSVGLATNAGLTSYVPGPGQFQHVTDLTNPFPLLVWAYSTWNLYHFGMQDFGIWRLWGGLRINRWAEIGICLGLVIFFVEVMRHITHSLWVMLFVTGLVSVNHWVVDLGLSVRVAGRMFLPGVLALGLIGFVWMVPSPGGQMIRMIPWIICVRLGLGFVHFLYSRWVWRLSDPLVRATIGRDLLTVERPSGL
jgi:hypothetical protein